MINQSLQQKLSQKLSPRQIQLMKLIQISSMEMEQRIKEELEVNPVLEIVEPDQLQEEKSLEDSIYKEADLSDHMESYDDSSVNLDVDSDSGENPFEYYYDGGSDNEFQQDRNIYYKSQDSFYDILLRQVEMLNLDEKQRRIAEHIIGSIDDDGYLRRTAFELSDDLAFKENLFVSEDEINALIKVIQTFEPAGVAAYDLQECLILQLRHKEGNPKLINTAIQVLEKSFNEFSKKNYNKIAERFKLDDEELKQVIGLILSLSPKPGNAFGSGNVQDRAGQYIYPDFFVTIENEKIHIALNDRSIPQLRVAPDFEHMLMDYSEVRKKKPEEKEAENFIRKNIDSAKWFIEAIQQRKETLLTTMKAIVDKQQKFFLSGNPQDLKPMILKDIADVVNLDISTISRVSRSKYVQTPFGTYPLKYFFTDSYTNEDGEDISVINVKNTLKQIIDSEDKSNPYSDAQLTELMAEKGYKVARRTIAKYRDQMQIPVAQLRRSL